jgi:spore maturation protein CgeB
MNIALFYHSLISDWNHGNAHFLRGIACELLARGHDVTVYEPANAWSVEQLLQDNGSEAIDDFYRAYPDLDSVRYDPVAFDVQSALRRVDLAIVHEWNDHRLVQAIGAHHKTNGSYRLFFHDTHHRSVTDPDAMSRYDLSGYDGVLAYGAAIAAVYRRLRWARRVWVWHEGADTRVFRPLPRDRLEGDLIWIGNWGDDERTAELGEFLIEPVKSLGLKARVYGVRYPPSALAALRDAGIEYGGWLPNYRVPEIFARYCVTVHIHRRPYVEALPGIPTIRPFEALACAIPLVCSPWHDSEGLFTPGEDYLIAEDGAAMRSRLRALLDAPEAAAAIARHGYETIHRRHTCAHRVDQLMEIFQSVATPDDVGQARM